jgi:hypothetical protein
MGLTKRTPIRPDRGRLPPSAVTAWKRAHELPPCPRKPKCLSIVKLCPVCKEGERLRFAVRQLVGIRPWTRAYEEEALYRELNEAAGLKDADA